MLSAFPLCWPAGWKRVAPSQRKNAQFSKRDIKYVLSSIFGGQGHSWSNKKWLTVSDGTGRILESLEKMGISRNDVVISTNVKTRLDGLPRSGEREPDDPGAAVYWRKKQSEPMRCMAIDRYTAVADNLAAIAATLEAMRAIERHGGAEILDRTFTGFAALPAQSGRDWWDVLEVRADSPRAVIEANFRRLAQDKHPDRGGSHEAMAELNEARSRALQSVS